MKAIILAAGCGRRLSTMGWNKPKCLLHFGEQTLLENIITSLIDNNIQQLSVVVGYQYELIVEVLEKYDIQFNVTINDNYATTNTIHSLYLARNYLDDDFIYFNADILFDHRIIFGLLSQKGNVFAVDVGPCRQEEVKVIVDENQRIVSIGKELVPDKCLGEFIGIGKFSRSACPEMISSLCRYNEQLNRQNLFFETAVNDILQQHRFTAWPIGSLSAIEIDNPQDYHQAMQLWLSKKIET